MNCIILLLLLGCCGGWGNDGSCGNDCGTGCRREMNRCTRENRPCGCGPRRPKPCGCVRERPCPGSEPCGCERVAECCDRRPEPCDCDRPCQKPEPCGCARQEMDCDAPASGLIPPPWQDYPRFPHRDGGDNCEA